MNSWLVGWHFSSVRCFRGLARGGSNRYLVSSKKRGRASALAKCGRAGTLYFEVGQLSGLLLQSSLDFPIVGKDAGFELGVNLCSVDNNLEAAVVIRDQGQSLNLLFVVGQYIFRQTDGFRLIASLCAIFNLDIHTAARLRSLPHSGIGLNETSGAKQADFAFLTCVVYAPAKEA